MFDIFNIHHVQQNPLLAKELVRLVPYEKLIASATTAGEDKSILDLEPIAEGIMGSTDRNLKLILATYGTPWKFLQDERLGEIFSLGTGHKAALLSNTKVNWYMVTPSSQMEHLYPLLQATLDESEKIALQLVMLCNPRMDRRLLAKAMRGSDEFNSIPITRRIEIGCQLITVDPLPEPWDASKDSPDSHEMYFEEPNDSFLAVLREAKECMETTAFNQLLANTVVWKVGSHQLGIKPEDWGFPLTEDDKNYSSAEEFETKFRARYARGFLEVLDFLADFYPDLQTLPADSISLARATVVIRILNSLLENHWLASIDEAVIETMLNHKSPIIRAAAYAKIFNNIPITQDENSQLNSFFTTFPDNTPEKWLGIVTTQSFWLLDSYGRTRRVIRDASNAAGMNENIEFIYEDLHKYLFMFDGSHSEREEKHNTMVRNNRYKIPNSPDTDDTKTSSAAHAVGFEVDEQMLKASSKQNRGLFSKFFG